MEVIPSHPVIKLTADEVEKTREFHNVNDLKRINEALDVIEEWLKKQEHLLEGSKYLDRSYLERIYILARGSVEGTKTKIDKLFTSRTLMPELCLHTSFKEFERFLENVTYVALPKLCPTDLSRVMVTQFLTDKIDDFSLLMYFRYCFMFGEYRLHYDYSLSERYILDLTNLHQLSFITKLNPILLKKAEILCSEGYGTKIKGIHILNAPSFVDKIVSILKQGLKEKVASRLFVHNSYEDLQKHVPKSILPADYGGDEASCAKLSGRDYLERLIISNKGSVERAKNRLETLCACRVLAPKYFEVTRSEDLILPQAMGAMMPTLTKDHCRVFIIKYIEKEHISQQDAETFLRKLVNTIEYWMANDYCKSTVAILDGWDLDPIEFVRAVCHPDNLKYSKMILESFVARVQVMHCLTPKLLVLDALKLSIKYVYSDKIYKRFSFHHTLDTLHEMIDKDILPVEYGGKEKSLVELHNRSTEVLSTDEFLEFRREMNKATIDTSIKSIDDYDKKYNHDLGAGTFRQLNVD